MAAYDWIFHTTGAILVLTGIAIVAIALFKDGAKGRRRCPKCWYDMAGIPSLQCPECGKSVHSEEKLSKTRRHWQRVFIAGIVFVAAWVVTSGPKISEHGWMSLIPTRAMPLVLMLFEDDALDEFNQFQASGLPASSLTRWEKYLIAYHGSKNPDLTGPMIRTRQGRMWIWTNAYQKQIVDLGYEARVAYPALLKKLTTSNAYGRGTVCQVFAALEENAQSVTADLISVLRHDKDEWVRAEALTALLAINRNARQVQNAVIDALGNDPSREVRLQAVPVVAAAADHSDKAFETLCRAATQDDDRHVRVAVVKILPLLTRDSHRRAETLAITLDDYDYEVREQTIEALGHLGPAALITMDRLVEIGLHDELRLAKACVLAIATIGVEATEPIMQFLDDERPEMRAVAATALGKIGSDAQDASQKLIDTLKDDPDPTVRRQSQAALIAILTSSSVLPILHESLANDQSADIRRTSFEHILLHESERSRLLNALRVAIKDQNVSIRLKALRAIKPLGTKAKEARPEIEDALNDENEFIRYAAADALKAIGAGTTVRGDQK